MTKSTRYKYSAVVVTGASNGIGKEFAILLADTAKSLILVGRDIEALKIVKNEATKINPDISITTLSIDLSRPGSADTLFNIIEEMELKVDLVINNAGQGLYGPFLKTEFKVEAAMIQLNIITLTHLTKLFANRMTTHGGGAILNIASTASFVPSRMMPVYCATKAFVFFFSISIALEMQKKGVRITVLCPGHTRTKFQDRADIPKVKGLQSPKDMNARSVAKNGIRAIEKKNS